MQLIEADRGDGRATGAAGGGDADLPVVPARILGQAGDPRQDALALGGRHGSDLQVQLLGPVLPVPVGRADQAEEAGAEDHGRHDRCDRHRHANQGAAHRDRGAPVPRLERHPDADAAGQRTSQPECGAQPGAAHGHRGLGQPECPWGAGGRPQRSGHHHQQRRGGDDDEPGAEEGQVDLDPGAGLGGPGGPDRHERGGRDGDPHGDGGPRDGHDGHPDQGERSETGPAHAECAQDGEFRRVEDELAAQQLPDDGQCDQARERREDRQGGRFRPDGPLGRRVLAWPDGRSGPPRPGNARPAPRPGG